MTQTDGILWAISDCLQAWFIAYKEDHVGRWSKNEDKWESNSTRVFTGVIETYIEWWKNSILGWRCDGTFLHLRHCSCKQLPGANEKQSDVGDWRSPWLLKCDLAVGWSSTAFWLKKFGFSWWEFSDVGCLPYIGSVAFKVTWSYFS